VLTSFSASAPDTAFALNCRDLNLKKDVRKKLFQTKKSTIFSAERSFRKKKKPKRTDPKSAFKKANEKSHFCKGGLSFLRMIFRKFVNNMILI